MDSLRSFLGFVLFYGPGRDGGIKKRLLRVGATNTKTSLTSEQSQLLGKQLVCFHFSENHTQLQRYPHPTATISVTKKRSSYSEWTLYGRSLVLFCFMVQDGTGELKRDY